MASLVVSHNLPAVDLGPHFCSTWPCQQQFTLVNRGRRLQALSWTTQGFSAAKLKRREIDRATRDTRDVGLKVGPYDLLLTLKLCVYSL